MTYRNITKLKCSCGHIGRIVESENDQPYSKEWSSTSLRELERNGNYSGPHTLISKLKPSCPKCGYSLSPEDIVTE